MSNYINGLKNGTRYRESGLVLVPKADYLAEVFEWLLPIKAANQHTNESDTAFKVRCQL
jgi:hypothetical protein